MDLTNVQPIAPTWIETEDQAKNYLLMLVEAAEHLRRQCNFAPSVSEHRIKDTPEFQVEDQRTWFLRWMIGRGKCLGALETLKLTKLISDVMYEEMRERIKQMGVPTVYKGTVPHFNLTEI